MNSPRSGPDIELQNRVQPAFRIPSPVQNTLRAVQSEWNDIVSELPPQLKRRHIGMISIGGVIGTGLFLGTADALRHGGPVGIFLGYSIMGTVVYCVVISLGEMVSYLPNVGGPVGLAHLYADPALAFTLGWNAWYNWIFIAPAEISAAAVLMNYYVPSTKINNGWWTSVVLVVSVAINCLGTRRYGEIEYWFSSIKVLTIIFLIILGIILDAGAGKQGPIGFKNWVNPGPFVQYLDIPGPKGRFLGFFSVLLQAAFSFFGAEVPGIAAAEVIDPTRNIPRAVRRVWIRIFLFYVLGVLTIALLVPSNDPSLKLNSGTGMSSPFVIAIMDAGINVLPGIINATFLLSAWSAAASDIYISSRFLFFLARRGHAPGFLGLLYRRGVDPETEIVVPWVGILVAAGFASLSFMSAENALQAFRWFFSMTSTAALEAWVAIMYTYIRWYKGTRHAAQVKHTLNLAELHRSPLQPYAAWYAMIMCTLVLVFNGWAVFTQGPWRIAMKPGDGFKSNSTEVGNPIVDTFVTSYLPIPLFLLLFFGYKLIMRSNMVDYDKMTFDRGFIPRVHEPKPRNWLERLLT